jgi:hypothetical protein
MKINYTNKTIEMTKAEAKAASIIASEEYKALLEIRQQNPHYEVFVIERPRRTANRSSDSLKGLTFYYMESYIKANGNSEQLEKLNQYRHHIKDGLEVKTSNYGKVKKWFLEQFPEIKEYRAQILNSLSETKQSA